jgi:hypothetical protein
MNKIDFDLIGGQGMSLKDWKYLQQSIRDMFISLTISDYYGDSTTGIILMGCRVSVGAQTSGYVAYGGEIYYVPSHSGAFTVPVLVPQGDVVDTAYSPVGFADKSSHNVHYKRQMAWEEEASQPVKLKVAEMADYGDVFHTVETDPIAGYDDWVGPDSGMLSDGYEGLKFRKRGAFLELQGACLMTTFASASIIFNLPLLSDAKIKYRPAYRQQIVVIGEDSNSDFHAFNCTIYQNGNVVINETTAPAAGAVKIQFNHRVRLY